MRYKNWFSLWEILSGSVRWASSTRNWTYLRIACWTTAIIVSLTENVLGQHQDISKILWTANWSNDGKYIAVGGVD